MEETVAAREREFEAPHARLGSRFARGAPLEEPVRVAGLRWRIESCFEAARGEFGLDQYEVRLREAWRRSVTLAPLAPAFVSVTRAAAAQGPEEGKGALGQTCGR